MSNIPTFLNDEEKGEYMLQQLNFVITVLQNLADKKQLSDADKDYFRERFKQGRELMAKATAALESRSSLQNGIYEGTQYVGPTSHQNQPYQNQSAASSRQDVAPSPQELVDTEKTLMHGLSGIAFQCSFTATYELGT
ncbi:hypothetical protein CTI12_AA418030 [Artemisia annua]|uniref:Uncharacterized protein n=1 Tax=Artemisia annua TaxID=35608 RepID=A0A2U1M5K8_ARTAN|nr:hypothetical protein CTI12_AA418030 [Artemisia annua]